MAVFLIVLLVIVISIANTFSAGFANNPCSNHKWRFNPQACLNFVREMTDDTELYWYGNNYTRSGCSYNDAQLIRDSFLTSRDIKCYNPRPKTGGTFLTLGSRIFNDNDYRSSKYLNKLNSILEVQFISPPELSYSGCNTTAQLPTTTVIDVYPGMPAVPAVLVRKPPRINPINCNFNQLCTIIFQGAGSGVIHNIWTNWPKENNFTNYYKPTSPTFHSDPYVLLAYYQSGEIKQVERSDIPRTPYNFSIDEFVKTNNLQGPFAINWVNVVVDISVQDEFVRLGFQNGCPQLLEELIKQDSVIINKDLGLSYPLNLNVWLSVFFRNEQLSYTSCCNQFQSDKKDVWIDALRNGRVAVEHVRNKPNITLNSSTLFADSDIFKGEKHTLLLVQPDISMVNPMSGQVNDAEVTVFWMVHDLVEGNISSGTERLSYLEPMPTPQRPANRFYLLLFKQNGDLGSSKVESFLSTTCSPDVFNLRCRFPLSRFASENQMKLVGFSRFRVPETAMHQPFVRYLWVKYNVTGEDQACAGAPNYPCKSGIQVFG